MRKYGNARTQDRIRNSCFLFLVILIAFSTTVEVYAQERKETTAKKEMKVEEVVHAKESLSKARELLNENPRQALEIINGVVDELSEINGEQALDKGQKLLYEDALVLKARAALKLSNNELTRKAIRQLLTFNPMFSRPITTPEEESWIEQVKNAEMGWLEISTDQPGVTVKIDGREVTNTGQEPARIPLFPGAYEVSLEKEDYIPKPLLASISAGRTQSFHDINLQRGFFSVPIISYEEGVEVYVNDELRGQTETLSKAVLKLSTEFRDTLMDFLDRESVNPNTVSIFIANKLPLQDEIDLYFSKPCFQGERRTLRLTEGSIGQLKDDPVLLTRRVSLVDLKPKSASLKIASNIPEARVFLNDENIGNTPLNKKICPGQYTLRIQHDAGRFEKKIAVAGDQETSIEAKLKPVITFLGLLPSEAIPTEMAEEAKASIAAHLKSDPESFYVEFASLKELEESLKGESLDIKEFAYHATTAAGSYDYTSKVVEKLADKLGTQLLLFGYFNPVEASTNTVTLYLFHKSHARPDIVKVSFKSDEDLKKIMKRMDSPANTAEILYQNWIGVKTIDAMLEEKQTHVVQVQPQSPAEKAGLKPGDIILEVDSRKRDTLEINKYLSTKGPGNMIRLLIRDLKGTEKGVSVPIMAAPVEIPIFNKDLFFNAYLAKLLAHFYSRGKEPEGGLAYFNAALCYIHFKDWSRALKILNEVNLNSTSGISKGTVYYHQARCYEAMGKKAEAMEFYRKAAAYEASTLGSNDGPYVAPLAQSRLKSLQ